MCRGGKVATGSSSLAANEEMGGIARGRWEVSKPGMSVALHQLGKGVQGTTNLMQNDLHQQNVWWPGERRETGRGGGGIERNREPQTS